MNTKTFFHSLSIIILIIFIACTDESPGPPLYEGPKGMIDDFEVDFYETDESIHEEDRDPLYIIVQEGRRGHWVPFIFPHPADTLLPDSSISLTHEACDSGMPPDYTAYGVSVSSDRAMHFTGTLGNPEGIMSGYVKILTDLATDSQWSYSSEYNFDVSEYNYNLLVFYGRAEEACKLWVSLPAMADGDSLAKGFLIEITEDWKLFMLNLDNYNPSGEPGAEEPITKAISLAFYLSTSEDHFNVAEGETKDYDIWIDDVRFGYGIAAK